MEREAAQRSGRYRSVGGSLQKRSRGSLASRLWGVNNECSGAVKARGHCVPLYPKFHCELNFIERYWCQAKCGYNFEVKETVPEALASVTNVSTRSFYRWQSASSVIILPGCVMEQKDLSRMYINRIGRRKIS